MTERHRKSGEIRRFGPVGPLYEVLDAHRDAVARIRLIESGEETDYPLAQLVEDPVIA